MLALARVVSSAKRWEAKKLEDGRPFFAGTEVTCLMRDQRTGKHGKVLPFFNPPPPDPA
jgi:hypothetical protein